MRVVLPPDHLDGYGRGIPQRPIFAIMNLSLYVAIDRIGLGLAVTLEFLGPLSVALLASRRVVDLGCALIAGAAVVVLARPQPSTDYVGIFLALLAALCWAGYILVNRVVGARLPGTQGPAAAAGLSALLYIPVGIWVLASHPVTAVALGRAATAGSCARPSRWSPICWRCGGSRPGSSVSS
jgi:inner membrane transporter RhtA